MSIFTGKSVDNFRQRADVLNREDIFCLSNKKIGRKNGDTDIYLMHYAYSGVIPTKVQVQGVVNKDFGQLVVIDPTEVMVGPHTLTVKAYTSYPLTEQTSPKKYINNLKASVDERPDTVLVELGDVVRYFDATVVEGQIVSADANGFAVRVGSAIERVAADSIIDVKQSPLFYPTDKAAYDYFLKLYPKDYVKQLTNNDKDHGKNPSWTETLSDSENKGEKELEKIHKLPTVQTWDVKKGEDQRPDHKGMPSWELKKGEDGRPANDGKGYTPAGDSWKEKEIADKKKEYSEGTESWFRQQNKK